MVLKILNFQPLHSFHTNITLVEVTTVDQLELLLKVGFGGVWEIMMIGKTIISFGHNGNQTKF